MAYSADVVSRATRLLEQQKADSVSRYNQRLFEAYAKVPRIRQIDAQLRLNMAEATQAILSKESVDAMERAKAANQALTREREELIAKHFGPDWLAEQPVCGVCGGSGWIGSSMCRCLEQLCAREQRRELSRLTDGSQTFQAFRLDYYPDSIDKNFGVSPRQIMERNLHFCSRYAREFVPGAENLLFYGGTGLGKTFLSACIANEVADKSLSICYESAPRLFSILEKNRFSPTEESRRMAENFKNCDLLIVDDLGTEMPGNFVTAALYSLVNDRLMEGKTMLISTNLNQEELAQRYSHQIASRLGGRFRTLIFLGEDIRVLKNRGMK